MTDPLIVHVVCEAEYESNWPVALFTSEDLAEQHAANCRTEHCGNYKVRQLPLLDHVPVRAKLHLHLGYVRHDDGRVEDEDVWTVDHWDYELPAEPVVTYGSGHVGAQRIHVAAASAEAAEAAFGRAARPIRQLAEENARR